MTYTRCFASIIGRIFRFATLLALFTTPFLATQAQDDDRAGAPGKLSVESRDTGILLSWEAPVSKDAEITNYVISGLHVRRGTGIVLRVGGATDGDTTSWTDSEATDPDLLYVYRVRALYSGVPGQWSGFVITGFERPELPVSPEPPQPGPTAAPPVAEVEPTAVPPPPEPTTARPEPEPTTAPPAAQQQQAAAEPPAPTAVPPRPEPTAVPPVVEVEPTAVPPPPEPTVARSEPEPAAAPPAAQQQPAAKEPPAPTAVPPRPEPTAVPPAVEVKPTAQPPPPEPTAARPEPQPTTAPPAAVVEPTAGSEGPGT